VVSGPRFGHQRLMILNIYKIIYYVSLLMPLFFSLAIFFSESLYLA